MSNGIVLSPSTASKLKTLIGERPGDKGGYVQGSGVRQVVHVLITSGPTDGIYECTPTAFNTTDAAWVTYEPALAIEANLGDLRQGDRYLAVRYGYSETQSKYVFVADNAYPLIGCHLEYQPDANDNDKIKMVVTPSTLAGDGLEVAEDSSSGSSCDTLAVKAGCGIRVDAEGVSVDPASLAGNGLAVEETSDGCPRLAIDIETGCGLGFDDSGKLGLDVEGLAGAGLVAVESSGCPRLAIDIEPHSESLLQVVTGIEASCCGLVYDVAEIRFVRNASGVVVDILGGETVSYRVDLSACCGDCSSDCSTDDSSSDDNSSSDSSGGGIETPCCPGMPTTLYLTTADFSGCSCLDVGEPIVLVYNSGTEKWEGSGTVCTNPVDVEFYCVGGSSWTIDIGGTVYYTTTAVCDPFYFNLTDVYYSALCEGQGNITVTE